MDDKLKEMLDVNIDDIEAKGKKRGNKNKTILVRRLLYAIRTQYRKGEYYPSVQSS